MQSPYEESTEENRRIHVLIADDEELFHKSCALFLRSTNSYDVDSVESGIDALNALKRQHFDVLILDYKMPHMSGLDVLQKMAEDKIDTPTIMLTGAGSENIAIEALKFGAYDYIRKDLFDLNHLPIIINGVYERYLFKKQKMLFEDLNKREGHNTTTAELTRNYISISSQLLSTTLSVVALVLEDTEKELKLNLPAEAKANIEKAYDTLKESYKIISFGTKSLLDLTRVISNRLEGTIDAQQDVEDLDAKLKILKQRMKSILD